MDLTHTSTSHVLIRGSTPAERSAALDMLHNLGFTEAEIEKPEPVVCEFGGTRQHAAYSETRFWVAGRKQIKTTQEVRVPMPEVYQRRPLDVAPEEVQDASSTL